MKNSECKGEMISVMLNICSRVISLIFLVVTLFSVISGKDICWMKGDVFGVIFIGLVSGAGFGIFYIKRNISRKMTFLLYVIYFLILNAVLFLVGFRLDWIHKDCISVATMEAMFVIVFFGVYTLMYLTDMKEADKINQKIKDRKNNAN
ncbi:MAG: DUF3021 family protein [Treponema sp.]|nr:DUF3021 family protein [Treponema sp.]